MEFAISRVLLLVTCYSICSFPRIHCDEQTFLDGANGNSLDLESNQENSFPHRRVITPKDETTSYSFDKLLRLLRANFHQRPIVPRNEQISGRGETLDASNEDLGDLRPLVHRPDSDITGSTENGPEDSPLGSRALNRRSVTALETKEDEARHNARAPDSVQPSNPNDKPSLDPQTDSSFVPSPVDRFGDQHSAMNPREQEANAEGNSFKPSHGLSGERNANDRSDSYRSQSDGPMLDLIRNRRFENLGFGLPGQPVRKLVDFVMNRLALKPTSSNVNQQSDSRSPRNLLEHARSLLRDVKGNIESGVSGVHKAVGLGSLSENSNTGISRSPLNFT